MSEHTAPVPDLDRWQARISDGENLWPSEQEWLIAEVQRLRRLYNEACEMGSGHAQVARLEADIHRLRTELEQRQVAWDAWRSAVDAAARREPTAACDCGKPDCHGVGPYGDCDA